MSENQKIENLEKTAKKVAEYCRLHLEHKNLNTLALLIATVHEAKKEFTELEIED